MINRPAHEGCRELSFPTVKRLEYSNKVGPDLMARRPFKVLSFDLFAYLAYHCRLKKTLPMRTALAMLILGFILHAIPNGHADEPRSSDAAKAIEKAEDLAEFQRIYRLAPGEDLKRIPPPRPAGIDEYWRRKYPNHGNKPTDFGSLVFQWSDHLENRSATSADGYSVRALPNAIQVDLHNVEVVGDQALLNSIVTGDFVFRKGVKEESMLKQLEMILQRDAGLPVRLVLRDVERNVVVARGNYRYQPLPGRSKNQIEIYGKDLVEDSGAGGGSGSFAEFLKWAGDWISRPIVAENLREIPKDSVSWRYHGRLPFTVEIQREDHDETLVLQHLSEQTGLKFQRERRAVRTLFVERID